MTTRFTDIHCHILPGIDDGADDLATAIQMARIAVEDGIGTMVATPHQLGNHAQNRAADIRLAVTDLQYQLDLEGVDLKLLPGADIRIEPEMMRLLRSDQLLTVADAGRHVLLELPHELYLPLETTLTQLARNNYVGILTHPERNYGLMQRPEIIFELVQHGCLMQVTAGSIRGTFGPDSQAMSHWMLREGLAHFVSTDAHGSSSRRPLMQDAFDDVCEIASEEIAMAICCDFPEQVVQGHDVPAGRVMQRRSRAKFSLARLLGRWAA